MTDFGAHLGKVPNYKVVDFSLNSPMCCCDDIHSAPRKIILEPGNCVFKPVLVESTGNMSFETWCFIMQ